MARIRLFPLLVVIVLAACTGDDDVPASTTSTTTSTVVLEVAPVESQADAYFDALAANQPDDPAAASAVPGSDAARYAEHQAAARGLLGVTTTRTLVTGGVDFEICELDDACTTYSAVVSDPVSGLVAGFSIDDVSVAGRIVGGGLVADGDGAVARVASAHQTNDGDVFVLVEIDNTTDVPIEMFGFAGVLNDGAGGTGVEAIGAWGDQQFPAGAVGELLLQFPAADLNGVVQLSGLRGDGLDISLDLRLPNPA